MTEPRPADDAVTPSSGCVFADLGIERPADLPPAPAPRQVVVPLRATGLALAAIAGLKLRGLRRAPAPHELGEVDARALTAAIDKRLRRQERRRVAA